MRTTIFKTLFKICLLLSCMAVWSGCNDSDEWEQEGMEISCTLVKTVENGTEVEYPIKISPSLSLKKDNTLEGLAVINEIRGSYMYNTDNSKFKIDELVMTELGSPSPYSDAEHMYLGYLRDVSSFKQEGETIKLYFGEDSYLEYKLKNPDDLEEEVPSYKLTGEGIYWKLTKAVENGKIIKNIKEEEDYESYKVFTLSFEGDGSFKETGKFKGYSSTNAIEGTYTANNKQSTIYLTEIFGTDLGESEFGYQYMDTLRSIYSWIYYDGCLLLYYGDNSYFQYELIEE
ncbi:META domain-containing protein [Parabacteroides acidifaciens]|uniref:META domain-containing protein n=1 Tax=Parabacteroides acidifaciens TaxID=2290935 RepID=A0A3D8HAP7_9BACT|nr:META domain-containing protein [Parabacteroides acidifaciens]MBC8603243.1 META domain-containing protein [Parabacteroides acidifaciens]RDU48008.1 META domain-containing protein [Parabacteroides acidifaciens]